MTHANSSTCPHCSIQIEKNKAANHIRWCKLNPNRQEYVDKARTNSVAAMNTPEVIARRSVKIAAAHARGDYAGAGDLRTATKRRNGNNKHTDATKAKLSAIGRANNYQRVCRLTHDFTDKRGRTFRFDSKWEDALAIRLDDLDVNWDRPNPLPYMLDGKQHNYFPDFYLPDYNVYIDPKNPYIQDAQKAKLDVLHTMINLIIIGSLRECQTFTPK